MKKMVLLTIFLSGLSVFCLACGGNIKAANKGKKEVYVSNNAQTTITPQVEVLPVLYDIEKYEGERYLVDINNVVYYTMGEPNAWIEFDDNVICISNTSRYAPGTSYYGRKYTGHVAKIITYSDGKPYYDTLEFGSEGGKFALPDRPFLSVEIISFVIDGAGTRFESDLFKKDFVTGKENKPVLHKVKENRKEFLADESGVIRYTLSPPNVIVDAVNNKIKILPEENPGLKYQEDKFDSYEIRASGSPRDNTTLKTLKLSSYGGEFEIPASPFQLITVQAFVIDGAGVEYSTERYMLSYTKHNQ